MGRVHDYEVIEELEKQYWKCMYLDKNFNNTKNVVT